MSKFARVAWPALQTTAAATAAWAISLHLAGHPEPFFAPIAAIVALNAPRAERGTQAVRLIVGVLIGIVVGELVLFALGGGYGRIALATFVAMLAAHAVGGTRLVLIQAAASATLTVAVANGESGFNRLIDALIGSSVAVVFSQVLFSPEPVRLLRVAETEALRGLANGLQLTADALAENDDALPKRALGVLRNVRDKLVELARVRAASPNVARHSAVWRAQIAPVARERVSADHLDLLGSACVMLARTAFALAPRERVIMAERVRELAEALAALATAPGDKDVRHRAAERAAHAVRSHTAGGALLEESVIVATGILRIVASDIMIFSGITPDETRTAIREGALRATVPVPPRAPRVPFGLDHRPPGGRS